MIFQETLWGKLEINENLFIFQDTQSYLMILFKERNK